MPDSPTSPTPLTEKLETVDRRIRGAVDDLVSKLQERLGERVEELNQDISEFLDSHRRDLPEEFSASRELGDAAAMADAESAALDQAMAAMRRIDGESGQTAVLGALLEEARRFASRTAFFLVRDDRVRGWSSRGFGDSTRIEGFETSYDGAPWNRLQHGALVLDDGARSDIARRLDTETARAAVLVPFVVRGRVAGGLYADRTDDEPLLVKALQLATYASTQAIETGAVSPGISPALQRADGVDESAADAPTATAAQAEADDDSEGGLVAAAVAATGAAIAAGAAAIGLTRDEPEADEEEPDTDTTGTSGPVAEVVDVEPAVEEPAVEEPVVEEPAVEEPVVEEPAPRQTAPEPPAVADDTGLGAPRLEQPALESAAASSIEVADPAEEDTGVAFYDAEPTVVDDASDDFELVDDDDDLWGDAVEIETVDADRAETSAIDDEPSLDETHPSMLTSEATEQVDFDDEVAAPLPSDDEIAEEIEPEPELEETNVWETVEESTETVSAESAPAPPEPAPPEPPALEPDALEPEPLEPADGFRPPNYGGAPPPPEPPTAATQPTPAIAPPGSIVPPPTPDSPMGQETVRLDVAQLRNQQALQAPPTPEVVAGAPSDDSSEDETMLSVPSKPLQPPSSAGFATGHPSSFTEPPPPVAPLPPAAAPAAPAAEPSSPSTSSPSFGSTEVKPPDDLEGPGLAFSQSPLKSLGQAEASDESAAHEEARRLARLLVSEIKLYNEELIEEGRRHGDIYGRLKDDIEKSRSMYEQRVDPRLLEEDRDYFHQELVQRLAGGDERLLGA